MANKEVVEQLLVQYITENADTVASYILDSVHASLGMYTEVSMQDIANAVRTQLNKGKKPTGIVFEEV